ncbi:MAG: CDP-diacylglycerol--serine O-phosphatidyltransferase [Proteobacteria bacterium]|nr:CDP-diacylglycerol--serine O-phosphatidyltransferase [Verrucomicrobiota bacterium]NBU08069.1 CDP-diacylglycerol--serine O-phosphatidyltransferase [Pseudomonadota bacterium]
METPRPAPSSNGSEDAKLRIYFLPNLMTAGNLFCGFLAITKIVESKLEAPYPNIRAALLYILLACIFDLLDGRVARMVGKESPFGREFDSLADVVSFGVAPAFLVHRIVLRDVFGSPELGWLIAAIYLICGAFRLARFNCMAVMPQSPSNNSGEFTGVPIPAAAGMVASLTLFLMWWDEKEFAVGNWRYVLPVLLLFLSYLMVSEVKYPSFKKLNWRAAKPFHKMLTILVILATFFVLWEKILPVVAPLVFTLYLIYGFIRPRISRQMRHDIEEDDEEDEEEPPRKHHA